MQEDAGGAARHEREGGPCGPPETYMRALNGCLAGNDARCCATLLSPRDDECRLVGQRQPDMAEISLVQICAVRHREANVARVHEFRFLPRQLASEGMDKFSWLSLSSWAADSCLFECACDSRVHFLQRLQSIIVWSEVAIEGGRIKQHHRPPVLRSDHRFGATVAEWWRLLASPR